MRQIAVLLLIVAVLLPGCAAPAASPTDSGNKAAAWAPEKPIEFVVHAGAGGGSDIMARTIADMMTKQKLIPQPITVVNRTGGGGMVAFTYTVSKKGDPYVWQTAASSFIATPLTTDTDINHKSFTMLAVIGLDDYVLVVNESSPYKTLDDLIEAAKANPKKLTFGTVVGSGGGADSICMQMLHKATGVEITPVGFPGSGDAMAALLGGHVDISWANPGEASELMRANKARPLGVTSPSRLETLPDVPTFAEMGYDVEYGQFRAIAAPPDLPKEAIAFYDQAFTALTESKEWNDNYIKPNMIRAQYMDSATATKYMEEQEQFYLTIYKELGIEVK